MKKLFGFVAITAFAALSCTPVFADAFTYTYTGNLFTTYNDDFQCYASVCSISGSFTTPTPLGDGFNGGVTLTSFSFTNGEYVVSSTDASSYVNNYILFFIVETNSIGEITSWGIFVEGCIYPGGGAFCLDIQTWNGVFNTTGDSTSFMAFDYAYNEDDPGTWTESVATPEPSSLLLLGTGLLGLGPLVRRRFARG